MKTLVTTMTSVDLELSRDGKEQIKLTCLLTDSAGHAAGSTSVTGKPDDLWNLIDRCGDGVCASIKAAPMIAGGDRRAESERFHREAVFCWSHGQREAALQAAEAAFALAPDSTVTRACLYRGLVERGAELLCSFQGSSSESLLLYPIHRGTPDRIESSLLLVRRGVGLLPKAGTAPNLITPEDSPDRQITDRIVRCYLAVLAHQTTDGEPGQAFDAMAITAEQQGFLDDIRVAFRRYRLDVVRPKAFSAVKDTASYDKYTGLLFDLLGDAIFCTSRNKADWLEDWSMLVPQWVELARQFDVDRPGQGGERRHDIETGGSNRDPTAKLLCAMRNYSLRGDSVWLGLAFDRGERPIELKPLTRDEADKFASIYAKLAEKDDPAFTKASESGLVAIGRTESAATIHSAIEHRRTSDARTSPAGVNSRPATRQSRDAASDHPTRSWKECRRLLDLEWAATGVQRLYTPVVVGDKAYCAAFINDPARPAIGLLRFDLSTGKYSEVGRDTNGDYSDLALPKPTPGIDRMVKDWAMRGAIAGDYYVLVERHERVLIFPLAGGPPVRLDASAGLPDRWIQSATFLRNRVYALVGDGVFVEYDPNEKTLITRASCLRRDARTPFDDSPPFAVSLMVSDQSRGRIVFFAASEQWKKDKTGVWEYDVNTNAFTQLLKDEEYRAPSGQVLKTWESAHVVGDSLLVVAGSWPQVAYDISSGKRSPEPIEKLNYCVHNDIYLAWPMALQGSWLYAAVDPGVTERPHGGLGRLNSMTGAFEELPPILTDGQSRLIRPVYLAKVDDHRMLIGDHSGLWVVVSPDE